MNAIIKPISVFPLHNHPLYQDANSLQECAYLTPGKLAAYTSDCNMQGDGLELEVCASCFFQSSGTSSRPKKVPYSEADLDRQRQHEALAFSKIGMKPDDTVVSLGAPPPSISAWAIANGSRELGARVLNESQLDYEDAIESPHAGQATVVFGTPIIMREIGKEIAQTFGSVAAVFPNLRLGILFGDVLPDSLRREIKELWGFEHVRSLYGTVEADVVATESCTRPGELELMNESLHYEFISSSELQKEREVPGYVPQAIPLDDAEHGTRGEIVISDLRRELLPLLRYRIGDAIEVVRHKYLPLGSAPNIRVLGRTKNTVNFRGIALYEMQINNALQTELPGLGDWRWTQDSQDHASIALIDPKISLEEAKVAVHAAISHVLQVPPAALPKHALSVELGTADPVAEVAGDLKSSRIQHVA